MAITHSTVLINTGQTVDNTTVSGNQRQITNLGGPDSADVNAIAAVQATQPAGTEMGLVVREAQKGQSTSANSRPVVLASDQSSIPVTGSFFQTTQPISGTVGVNNFPTTQPISGTVSATVSQSTAANLNATVTGTIAATQSGTWTVQPGNTANTTAWKVDGSAVTQPVSGTVAVTQSTSPWVVTGSKTNNSAAPSTTNLGTLPALSNAAPVSFTEGNQTSLSMDLAGNLRVYGHPPNVLGAYMVNGRTGTYAGQAAAAPLVSFRWTSATALAIIMRVSITVATTVAATAVGNAERELIIARSFTVSDTGGTAVTLTGNNQKMRTSQATSLVGDFRFGQPLTAGTRTLDAAPIASTLSVLPLLFTGIDIGTGGIATTTLSTSMAGIGGIGMIPLLNATTGQDYPIVLAQNEGIIIRIGKDAQPAGATQQTYAQISWCEVSAY